MSDTLSQSILVAVFVILVSVYAKISEKPPKRYPPGPRGLPIVGNALQVPYQHMCTYFRDLVREYGGPVWLNVFGFGVLIIGDMKTAKDVLDKRSANFSSRPTVPFTEKYVDPDGSHWAFHSQNDNFHTARRLTATVMSSVRAGLTEPLQLFETLLTLQNLLDNPNDWMFQINRLIVSTVFTAGYGLHLPKGDEPDLKEVLYLIEESTAMYNLSGSVINFFPALDWIPGPMPWRTRARKALERDRAFYSRLVYEAVYGHGSGMNTWAATFANEDIEENKPSRFLREFTQAAIETTVSSLKVFVLASIIYPKWVVKAQQELDDIVGPNRLPTFADRPRLPYIEGVVRETLRWRPAARGGVPHSCKEDDLVDINGQQYNIPAGTIVFGLSWAIEHDPSIYTDPDLFNPDRFLDINGELLSGYETSAFGFGRRACPGSPFAERSMWIAIALLLWTFDIRKSEQIDSKTGFPFPYDSSDAAFAGDLTNPPLAFPATFSPRSTLHAEVARREWEYCEKDLNVILPAPKSRDAS